MLHVSQVVVQEVGYCCYCVFAYITLSVYTAHQEQFSRKHTLLLNQVNTHIFQEGRNTYKYKTMIYTVRQLSSTTVYRRTIPATSVRFTIAPMPSSQSSQYFTWIAPVNSPWIFEVWASTNALLAISVKSCKKTKNRKMADIKFTEMAQYVFIEFSDWYARTRSAMWLCCWVFNLAI